MKKAMSNSLSTPKSTKRTILQVDEEYGSEMKNHIKLLNGLDLTEQKYDINSWVNEALVEELEVQKNKLGLRIPKDITINLEVPLDVMKLINEQVEFIKKSLGDKGSYSFKKWAIKAIKSKHQREASLVREKLTNKGLLR